MVISLVKCMHVCIDFAWRIIAHCRNFALRIKMSFNHNSYMQQKQSPGQIIWHLINILCKTCSNIATCHDLLWLWRFVIPSQKENTTIILHQKSTTSEHATKSHQTHAIKSPENISSCDSDQLVYPMKATQRLASRTKAKEKKSCIHP